MAYTWCDWTVDNYTSDVWHFTALYDSLFMIFFFFLMESVQREISVWLEMIWRNKSNKNKNRNGRSWYFFCCLHVCLLQCMSHCKYNIQTLCQISVKSQHTSWSLTLKFHQMCVWSIFTAAELIGFTLVKIVWASTGSTAFQIYSVTAPVIRSRNAPTVYFPDAGAQCSNLAQSRFSTTGSQTQIQH